jgi:hypothetical protein
MPQRVQLSRAKGWCMPPNTVMVARPGSKWGNEFRVGDTVHRFGETFVVRDHAHAVELFRERMTLALRQHPAIMRSALDELRGRNLACWCPLSEPCHADVLIELANAP